jgi:hypothetical protein
MLTKLKYQVKIHTLSDKPREKKISCKFSLFFIYLNKNNKQYGNDIICKGKIKPVYAQ